MQEIDAETKKLVAQQQEANDLVNHRAWGWARKKLADKIIDLQNAFNIESSDPTKMLIDLESRKLATQILWDWVRDIEGTASQSFDNKPMDKSFIVKLD